MSVEFTAIVGDGDGGKRNLQVEAEKVGEYLYVHLDTLNGKTWTVSHHAGSCIWIGLQAQADAMKLANSISNLDWAFTDNRYRPELADAVRKAVREAGL